MLLEVEAQIQQRLLEHALGTQQQRPFLDGNGRIGG
jgi:hypothetical protein